MERVREKYGKQGGKDPQRVSLSRTKRNTAGEKKKCLEAVERNLGQEMLLMVLSQEMLSSPLSFPCDIFIQYRISHFFS